MYFNEKTIVYLNGEWILAQEAKESLYNQTMHYGNGVFEGIRSYKTSSGAKIFKAKDRYERLLHSAERMHIKTNYSVDDLTQWSYELLEKNGLQDAYIRPLIYLNPMMSLVPVQKSNLFLCTWEWGKYLGDQLQRVMISSYQRPNPKSCHVEAKTVGHYTNSILATTEAKQKGFDEALLLDMNENVAEASGANFFFEKNETLYTPPLGNILPGITRQTIIDLAKELHIKLKEKFFSADEVKIADSAFFTGTAAEVVGLQSLDDYVFPKAWKESLGYQLANAYQQLVTSPEKVMA